MITDRCLRLTAAWLFLPAVLGTAASYSEDSSVQYDETAVLYIQNATDNPQMIELLEPQTLTVDLRACASTVSGSTLNISFKIDPAYVDVYNEAHGTDYKILPPEAYDMSASGVILPRYNEVSSTSVITLKSEGMGEDGPYILPVVFGQIKGSDNYTLADEGAVYYILLKKKVLPQPVEIDRSGWKIVYCSSEYEESNGGIRTGLSKDLIDGKPETYWTYNYKWPDEATKYAPFYIVIDMGEDISVRGVGYLSRQDKFGDPKSGPRCPPKNIRVDLAPVLTTEDGMNNSDWIYSEEFTGLPFVMENTVYLSEIHRVRYVRFVYGMGYNGSISKEYKGGTLAEIYVQGNYEDILQ